MLNVLAISGINSAAVKDSHGRCVWTCSRIELFVNRGADDHKTFVAAVESLEQRGMNDWFHLITNGFSFRASYSMRPLGHVVSSDKRTHTGHRQLTSPKGFLSADN